MSNLDSSRIQIKIQKIIKVKKQKEDYFASKENDIELSEIINKDSKLKEFNTSVSEKNNRYKDILKNYNDKYVEIKDKDNKRKIIIPKYSIIIKDKLKKDFYPDIYGYLNIEKCNLNMSRYSITINKKKQKIRKENKKRN